MTKLCSWLFCGVAVFFFSTLFALMVLETLPAFESIGTGYLTGRIWAFRHGEFGCWPMIFGTLAVAGSALLLAAPIGVAAAICTAEYMPPRALVVARTVIEMLAGIPSVVYGLLGVLILRNWIYWLFESHDLVSGDTLLTAGVLLAVMILPTIVSLTHDALRAVPANERLAAKCLGLTQAETIWFVVLNNSRRGIVAALLLALGRASGETIATFLVVGRQDSNAPIGPLGLDSMLEAGQTLTSKLGGPEVHIAYGHPLHWAAIVGLGLILMALVGGFTILGLQQRRHVYA